MPRAARHASAGRTRPGVRPARLSSQRGEPPVRAVSRSEEPPRRPRAQPCPSTGEGAGGGAALHKALGGQALESLLGGFRSHFGPPALSVPAASGARKSGSASHRQPKWLRSPSSPEGHRRAAIRATAAALHAGAAVRQHIRASAPVIHPKRASMPARGQVHRRHASTRPHRQLLSIAPAEHIESHGPGMRC